MPLQKDNNERVLTFCKGPILGYCFTSLFEVVEFQENYRQECTFAYVKTDHQLGGKLQAAVLQLVQICLFFLGEENM